MTKNHFSRTLVVPKSAIDVRGHVNNITYLEWCLDVAEKHWKALAPKELRDNYVWYVLNHYIEYKASAFEGQELIVETWVETLKGVRSERHYKIMRATDNTLIVNAKTNWCLLDAKTIKPTRIPKEFHTLF